MNILVDGRAFSRFSAGITSFLRCALSTWAKTCPSDTFYIILPKSFDDRLQMKEYSGNVIFLDRSSKWTKRIPNIILFQMSLPILCLKYKINLYYSPATYIPFCLPRKTSSIVTVHDVVCVEHPNTMVWTNRLANLILFKYAINHADKLWAVSNYTKEKIEHYFANRKCKNIVVGSSVDRNIFKKLSLTEQQRLSIIRKHNINNHYILFVGSIEPRKNIDFLIEIMPEIFKSTARQLVIVGANKWKNSYLNKITGRNDYPHKALVFCNYVSDEELVELYNYADCFVSASLNEGFGMPQLEAMLCGCPIVTSHNSAMIEVAANKPGAYTIEGYDKTVWVEKIKVVINKDERCIDTAHLEQYDWNKIMPRVVEYINH